MDKNQKHWLKNMVAWAEMKVSLEYPKAEYASFVEAVDALQIDLDNVDSQAARIAELERDNANQAKLLDALRETISQMEHEDRRTMKSKVCGHEFEHEGWPSDELCPDCYFEKEDTDEVAQLRARIARLEQALRQAQSLLRSSQSNWNEQVYFDADTVIANALK